MKSKVFEKMFDNPPPRVGMPEPGMSPECLHPVFRAPTKRCMPISRNISSSLKKKEQMTSGSSMPAIFLKTPGFF